MEHEDEDEDEVEADAVESVNSSPLNSSRLQTEDGDEVHVEYDVSGPLDPNRKISPLHRDIQHALSSSSFLAPIHVDVRNESYWYRSRSRLGPKRQNAMIVRQNPKTSMFEAYMYKMKVINYRIIILLCGHYIS